MSMSVSMSVSVSVSVSVSMSMSVSVCLCLCLCLCVCWCVCVCVCVNATQLCASLAGEVLLEGTQCVCVCVCVCERERERERKDAAQLRNSLAIEKLHQRHRVCAKEREGWRGEGKRYRVTTPHSFAPL